MCRWLHRCIWHVGLGHRGIGRPQLKLVIQKASKRPFSQRGDAGRGLGPCTEQGTGPYTEPAGARRGVESTFWALERGHARRGIGVLDLFSGVGVAGTQGTVRQHPCVRIRQQTQHNARESAQEL